jgi:hypothetical protein
MTRKHLVLEYVPVGDPMFQKLLEFRVNLFEGLTLERCVEVFQKKFEVVRQQAIPDSPRTLLLLKRR